MRILIADTFPGFGLDALDEAGHTYQLKPDLDGDSLTSAVSECDILVVRSTPVTRMTIDASNKLSLIIRAGAGTNTIDTKAASERDISVCNVPGRNAIAVAELAIGLLISIDRNIPDNVTDLRDGWWNKKKYSAARGLFGRSIGIVGVGAIGLAVLERAHGFGLEMWVIQKVDRESSVQERLSSLGVHIAPDLDSLIDRCDILSFHLPGLSETRGMVNANFLSKVHRGTILINTSRGDLIEEQALLAVLDEKELWVGLDVYCEEPKSTTGKFSSALARHPRVYGTHHIGASTAQAQQAVTEGVLDVIESFVKGSVINCVNN